MSIRGYYRSSSQLNRQPTALEIVILRFTPETTFELSVQPEANRHHHIVRGTHIPGTDFCGAYAIDLQGRPRSGAGVYDGTWTTEDHVSRITRRRQTEEASARGFVGAGNITMNPGFIGFANDTLFYVQGQSFAQRFHCLEFGDQGGAFSNMSLDPSNPPSTMGLAGPVLVKEGIPVQDPDIETMAANGQFYDLRHIIQFPSLTWPEDTAEQLHIHVGLSSFWEDGELQPDIVASALRGEIISIDLGPYTRRIPQFGAAIGMAPLRARLLGQGYRENAMLDAIGDFSIDDDKLLMRYFPGIYNHSIIGTDRVGNVVWLGIKGFGNSLGLTMIDTAALAAEHMHNAILVDNGGDVMCRLREEWIVPSAYNRNRIRALVLFSGLEDPIREDKTLQVDRLRH